MPRYILKTSKDADLYVEWSTIVDAPTGIGTREQMLKHFGPACVDRIERADRYGSSAFDHDYGWNSNGMIYMLVGWLPRENLHELAVRLEKNGNADVADLLKPLNDDVAR